MEVLTRNPSQTKKIGEKLAKKILNSPPKEKAFVIGLIGDLGGGKTTFLQGFAKGLGIKKRILSPTFVILKRFKISKKNRKNLKFKYFYHIDCYRLKKRKELLDLGFKKIISNPESIVAIEWAEKVKKILPKVIIQIKFELSGKNSRKLIFKKNLRELKK